MSVDEFYARPAAPVSPVQAPPKRAGRSASGRLWLVAALAAAALVIGVGAALWPHGSTASHPDPATARLFGEQTRAQLPQPVTADDCAAAVKAFAAIAADAPARAAFIEGCVTGR